MLKSCHASACTGSDSFSDLPDETVRHIKNVINFFWETQLQDAVDFVSKGNSVDNHVFSDMVAIDNALFNTSHSAEGIVEDQMEVNSWRL